MSAWQAILERYQASKACGKPAVLATVVRVSGSAYRRPGAKMLIGHDGACAGLISGGCLEQDLCQRALQVFDDKLPRIIHYDNRLLSGCNGQIDVLLELADDSPTSFLALMRLCSRTGQTGCIATTLPSQPGEPRPIDGWRAIVASGTPPIFGKRLGIAVESRLIADMEAVIATRAPAIHQYDACDGQVEAFLEPVTPPLSLVIFGGGPDVPPLVRLAKEIGWRTTVVDFVRRQSTSKPWYKLADQVVVGQRSQPPPPELLTAHTPAVVMTHDFSQDIVLLEELLKSPAPYIGVLGPWSRTSRLLDHLDERGIDVNDQNLRRLYGPIGLDLGADGPEEVALSIVAEIKAVIAGRPALHLRDRAGPIHSAIESKLVSTRRPWCDASQPSESEWQFPAPTTRAFDTDINSITSDNI